jgi:hypothetical protein
MANPPFDYDFREDKRRIKCVYEGSLIRILPDSRNYDNSIEQPNAMVAFWCHIGFSREKVYNNQELNGTLGFSIITDLEVTTWSKPDGTPARGTYGKWEYGMDERFCLSEGDAEYIREELAHYLRSVAGQL